MHVMNLGVNVQKLNQDERGECNCHNIDIRVVEEDNCE